MSISDILQKVISGEELTEEEQASLKEYKEPDVDGIVKSRLAREQKKHQKEIEEMKSTLESLQVEQEEKEDDGKSTTALERKIARLEDKLAKREEELKASQGEIVGMKRGSAISKIRDGLDLVKGYDKKYVDWALSEATKDMDVDEIADSIEDLQKSFIESNPQLIKAPGSGTGVRDGDKPAPQMKFTGEQIAAMSPAELLKNEAAIKEQIKKERGI